MPVAEYATAADIPQGRESDYAAFKRDDGTEVQRLIVEGEGFTLEHNIDGLKRNRADILREKEEATTKLKALETEKATMETELQNLRANKDGDSSKFQDEIDRLTLERDAAQDGWDRDSVRAAVQQAVHNNGGHELLIDHFTKQVKLNKAEDGSRKLVVTQADGQPARNSDGSDMSIDQLVEQGKANDRLKQLYDAPPTGGGDIPPNNRRSQDDTHKLTKEEANALNVDEWRKAYKEGRLF